MEPRALAAAAATTVAIVSTIAALLAHAPGPAITSTTSYAIKADEAMSAIAAGPLRQPWHPGARCSRTSQLLAVQPTSHVQLS